MDCYTSKNMQIFQGIRFWYFLKSQNFSFHVSLIFLCLGVLTKPMVKYLKWSLVLIGIMSKGVLNMILLALNWYLSHPKL